MDRHTDIVSFPAKPCVCVGGEGGGGGGGGGGSGKEANVQTKLNIEHTSVESITL